MEYHRLLISFTTPVEHPVPDQWEDIEDACDCGGIAYVKAPLALTGLGMVWDCARIPSIDPSIDSNVSKENGKIDNGSLSGFLILASSLGPSRSVSHLNH